MIASSVVLHENLDSDLSPKIESLLARLTRAAYDVALNHSPHLPFTELELALWRELRNVLQAEGGVGREMT